MLSMLRQAPTVIATRLLAHRRQTLAFAALGTVTERLTQAPEWFSRGLAEGWEAYLPVFMRDTLACAIASLMVSCVLRVCIAKGSDLLRRPARFICLLLGGASAATFLSAGAAAMMSGGADFAAQMRLDHLAHVWLQTVLWGGLIGWLYLLSLQHADDQNALAGLLVRRASLERRLARTRLCTARAQVDPAMVARVLDAVRRRYPDQPVRASALLDTLIGYLRLALNRGQGQSGPAAEIALFAAEHELRMEPAHLKGADHAASQSC